jgi:sugar phosphate isomerase/epimerase
MHVSITNEYHSGYTLESSARFIKNAGYTHICLSTGQTEPLLGMCDADIIGTKKVLDAQGLKVDWVHAPHVLPSLYCNERELWSVSLGSIRKVVEIAGVLQARSVVVHPTCFNCTQPNDHHLFYEQLYKALVVLVDDANNNNTKIALENLLEPWINNMVESLLKSIDGLFMCFDTGHANLSNSIEKIIDSCGDKICALHMHDNFGETDEHLIPGEGNIDWVKVVKMLKARGYNGAWGLECFQKGNNKSGEGEELAVRIYQFISDILKLCP